MNELRITTAVLMGLYGVTRPTALNWFTDRLIEGERGEGITDSWIATWPALIKFHNKHIKAVNVSRGGELLNLSGPWHDTIPDLAEFMKVTRGMAYRYVMAGYVPGAIKLPYRRGDWKLPKGYKDVVKELKEAGARDLTIVISTPLPDPYVFPELVKGLTAAG